MLESVLTLKGIDTQKSLSIKTIEECRLCLEGLLQRTGLVITGRRK